MELDLNNVYLGSKNSFEQIFLNLTDKVSLFIFFFVSIFPIFKFVVHPNQNRLSQVHVICSDFVRVFSTILVVNKN